MNITQTVLSRYTYDPLDRLASCFMQTGTAAQRFYLDGQPVTEVQGLEHRSVFRAEGRLLAQVGPADKTLLCTDRKNSVLRAASSNFAYTPYGHREPVATLPGFNGEQPEAVTGHYLLGAGYRAFNPVLMRFNSPDNLSPFHDGGLNAYAFCLGDPVNGADPSGHLSWSSTLKAGSGVFGIVLGLVTFGRGGPLAVAALVTGVSAGAIGVAQIVAEDTDQQLSQTLDEIGLVLGTASLGFGAFAALKGGLGPRLGQNGREGSASSLPSAGLGRPGLRHEEFDMRNLTVGNQRPFRADTSSRLEARLHAVQENGALQRHGPLQSQRAGPYLSGLPAGPAGYSIYIPRIKVIRQHS